MFIRIRKVQPIDTRINTYFYKRRHSNETEKKKRDRQNDKIAPQKNRKNFKKLFIKEIEEDS